MPSYINEILRNTSGNKENLFATPWRNYKRQGPQIWYTYSKGLIEKVILEAASLENWGATWIVVYRLNCLLIFTQNYYSIDDIISWF